MWHNSLKDTFLQGNAACNGKQWNKAIDYYSQAIELNDMNPIYYLNRAAAYIKLEWYEICFFSQLPINICHFCA